MQSMSGNILINVTVFIMKKVIMNANGLRLGFEQPVPQTSILYIGLGLSVNEA